MGVNYKERGEAKNRTRRLRALYSTKQLNLGELVAHTFMKTAEYGIECEMTKHE